MTEDALRDFFNKHCTRFALLDIDHSPLTKILPVGKAGEPVTVNRTGAAVYVGYFNDHDQLMGTIELPTGGDLVTVERAVEEVAATEWQPIETAPKDQEILAISLAWEDGKRPILLRWFKYNGLEAWRDWDNDPHFPTHWMPLPQPPKADPS
jgi:hypothetical protein